MQSDSNQKKQINTILRSSKKKNSIVKSSNSSKLAVAKDNTCSSINKSTSLEQIINTKSSTQSNINTKADINNIEKKEYTDLVLKTNDTGITKGNNLHLPIIENSQNSVNNYSASTGVMVDAVLRQRMSSFLQVELDKKQKQNKIFNQNKRLENTKKDNEIIIKQKAIAEEIKKDIEDSTVILKNIENRNVFSPYKSVRAKLALTAGLSLSGVVAVANIPTSALVSQERVVENMNIQLNILTEKNAKQSYIQVAHLEKSDSLSTLFKKLGIDDIRAENFVKNNPLARLLLQTKSQYTITAEINENKELLSLKAIIHSTQSSAIWLHITKGENGVDFTANKQVVSNVVETEVRSGVIDESSFFTSMDKAGVDDNITKQMTDIFASTINFHHDIKKGDKFRLVFERKFNQNEFVGFGRIIAAEIVNKKGVHQAIWYPKNEQYYTFNGDALKRSFLQSPVEVSRVTSEFGSRHHPIFGYSHVHTGVDFAAPIGTNVFSSADGQVDFVGTQNGYGKIVIIKHANGVSTHYAHLSAFHVKVGQAVKQGELIAGSGNTGNSTGAHLHYEYRINNVPQNPLEVLDQGMQTLAGLEKDDFNNYTRGIMKQVQALREFNISNQL